MHEPPGLFRESLNANRRVLSSDPEFGVCTLNAFDRGDSSLGESQSSIMYTDVSKGETELLEHVVGSQHMQSWWRIGVAHENGV